jgi:hypothetical protein
MIRKEKYNQAIRALHQIFVRGRFMAYTEEPYQDIARLLDYAERMPEFIASEIDETAEFASYLQGIVESFPNCSYILTDFNADAAPDKW